MAHAHILVQRPQTPGHFGCATAGCGDEWDDLHAAAHEYAVGEHVHEFEILEHQQPGLVGARGYVVQLVCPCGQQFAAVLVPRQARASEVGIAHDGPRFDPAAV